MPDQITLERRDFEADETSFYAIRKEGLQLAQAFCGGVWSDYNLHDPGVTSLEHLCYGLTDLMHRTGFPTADYFTGEDGFVPEAVGMYKPETILPCGPVTGDDLRKYLFDWLEGVENVWVEALPGGLWQILLRVGAEADTEALVAQAEEAYHGVRGLGEDLLEVVVFIDDPHTLEADVELDGTRAPSQVMAEIYHVCNGLLAPGIRPESPSDLKDDGEELSTVFDGPLTRHGILSRCALSSVVERVSVTEVIGAVRQVGGVLAVKKLCFVKDGLRHFVCIEREHKGCVLSLVIPKRASENRVALFHEGKKIAVPMEPFKGLFSALEFGDRRPASHDPGALYALPEGVYRNFGAYPSIQNHFPNVYGINAFGVPESFPPERKAAAMQLKGYLALMEQFLADGMATLDAMPELFSPDPKVRKSRFGTFLNGRFIAGMDALRTKKKPEAAHVALLKRHDAFHARRNAFLSHLLSLYGESVAPEPLRRADHYFGDTALDEALIQVRTAFLKRLPELSAHRRRGAQLMKPSGEERNIPPFQVKSELLLGCYRLHGGSLTQPITRDSLTLVSDAHYLGSHEGSLAVGGEGEDPLHMEPVPPADKKPRLTCNAVGGLMDAIAPFQQHLLFDSLLRGGVSLSRYRLVSLSSCDDVQIAFSVGGTWIRLGSARHVWNASRLVHLLRRYLIYLNMATEGMHVVEHLLLRPLPDNAETPLDAFYTQRVSILFPDWTDRFDNEVFRTTAMEVVSKNLPVHLLPAFHFLSFNGMQQFETLWFSWQSAVEDGDLDQRESLAQSLRCLLERL